MRERVHKGSLLGRGVRSVPILRFHLSMLWGQCVMLRRVLQGLGCRQRWWKLLPKVPHDLPLPAEGGESWNACCGLVFGSNRRDRDDGEPHHARRLVAACSVSAWSVN